MTRTLLILAAIAASLAPPILAQNPTVCVFQLKQHHTKDIDAVGLADTFNADKSPGKPALDFVTIAGFTAKEVAPEAQRRNCAWVVTLQRDPMPPDTPNYAGTLGSSGPDAGHVAAVNGQGGPVAGVSNSTIAANPDLGMASQDGDMLEYTLRKGDNKKTLAHGDTTQPSLYDPIVAAIVKKVDKAK